MADLSMIYNMLHDKISVNNEFFTLNPNRNLRGHPLKITVQLAKTNTHKFFFSNRIISVWNSLPAPVVLSRSTLSFKHNLKSINLDKYLIFHSIYE